MKNVEELMELLKIYGKTELAKKFGKAPSAVTYWINNGVPDSIWKMAEEIANMASSEFVLVPRYNVEGSAGGGALVDQEEVLEYLSFRKEWIKNSLRIGESCLAVISVKGDSMEPRLRDGDVVLLDMSAKTVEDNAIYALQFNGGLSIKRVQRFMSGALKIISDNKVHYGTEELTPEQAADVKVVGRVVWAGGKV